MAEVTKELNTPLYQRVGANLYKLNLETVAAQVKLEDGTDVQAAITNIQNVIAQNTTTYVVADIEARDALENVIVGDSAWVIDATGDETVESGAAKYIYQSETDGWVKVSEAESMDVVVNWDSIEGKPEVLDELGLDDDGNLTVNGSPVTANSGTWVTLASSLDDLPSDLMDGGLIVVDLEDSTDDGNGTNDGDGEDDG